MRFLGAGEEREACEDSAGDRKCCVFRINEVNLTDPESLCEGGKTWVTAHRA